KRPTDFGTTAIVYLAPLTVDLALPPLGLAEPELDEPHAVTTTITARAPATIIPRLIRVPQPARPAAPAFLLDRVTCASFSSVRVVLCWVIDVERARSRSR